MKLKVQIFLQPTFSWMLLIEERRMKMEIAKSKWLAQFP
jgi:hypothetical protein